MPPFRSILLSCLLACFSLNAVAALRIAAQTLDESEPVVETVAATLDHLRARIPADFELNYYAADEMEAVVKEGKADAVIIDAASFASFQKNDGVWALASMKSPLARDSAHTTAAAFIVRADHHDLTSLDSIRDKIVVATSPSAFESRVIGMAELRRLFGNEPIFRTEVFTYGPAEQVVHAIAAGKGDVGIVDACLLERMEAAGSIVPGTLAVLGQKHSTDLRCRHSTDLYPGWVFGVCIHQDLLTDEMRDLIGAVSSALLTVPRFANVYEWASPADSSDLLELVAESRRHDKSEYGLVELWRGYGIWLMALLGGILIMIVHSFYVGWLVRRRTAQLVDALQENQTLQTKVGAERDRIAALEKAGVAGQMSSMIAHELQQPLSAVVNYGRGVRIRLDRGFLDEETLRKALAAIVDQGMQAADIVNRVRAYAHMKESEHKMENMVDLVRHSIERFKSTGRTSIEIELGAPETIMCEVNSLEIELMIHNLLKNGYEACAAEPHPSISITMQEDMGFCRFTVEDNGPTISDDEIARLFVPLRSSKTGGLGLGLSICQGIAESHGGRIDALRGPNGHLIFFVCLPLAHPGEKNK